MQYLKLGLGVAALSLLGGGVLVSCEEPGSTNPDMAKNNDFASAPDLSKPLLKAVYTMSNDVSGNQIVAYTRAADGSLTLQNTYPTAGKGSGDPLGNQSGLIFNSTTNQFFAVNAGDNTISMLALNQDGTLTLQFKILSGGVRPVSVTEANGVVYVVNAGEPPFTPPNIAGFQVAGSMLTAIQNSSKPLSTASAQPAQIQFAQNGSVLVVTEKNTNKISTYTVSGGLANGPNAQASNGMTPYGFAITSAQKLVVSEAAAMGANMGSASSYSIDASGQLTSVSSRVMSMQTSPCWVTLARNTAYITNAATNNVSAYTVGADGTLSLVGSGVAAMTGMGPTEEDATEANDFLYVINSRDHSFSIFAINADGTLVKKPDFPGIPMFANGLVAR